MLITIDIGNTSTVIGLFKGEQLKGTWRVGSDTHRTADEYRFELEALLRDAVLCPEQVRGACIASVVPEVTCRPLGKILYMRSGVSSLAVRISRSFI